MTPSNDLEFEADLGIWECFGGKDIMFQRQKEVVKEILEW